jgi:hypothetical protein
MEKEIILKLKNKGNNLFPVMEPLFVAPLILLGFDISL